MPDKFITVSAKKGDTAADRRILTEVYKADIPTKEPVKSIDGQFLNRVQFVHLMFELNNPDTIKPCIFYVQLWWWSPITDVWHKAERLKVNANDIHTIEVQGLNRLYLQVDAISYSGSETPYLNAWLAAVVPV
jgi:hypothetical protein